MNDPQKSTKSPAAVDKTAEGWTDEERAAMKERSRELKAAGRRGPRGKKADEESAVLAKIAELPEPDRAMAERIHDVIKTSAPGLSPKLWYGMPAYAKDGKVVASSRARRSSSRDMQRSASTTMRTSTKAPCGPPHSP